MYICVQLRHFTVQQKLTQHCKSNIHEFKKLIKKTRGQWAFSTKTQTKNLVFMLPQPWSLLGLSLGMESSSIGEGRCLCIFLCFSPKANPRVTKQRKTIFGRWWEMLGPSSSFLPRDRFLSPVHISNSSGVVFSSLQSWQEQCARVGTPGESKGARSHPRKRMLGWGRAGLAQPVQPSQERASQIWLSKGDWVGAWCWLRAWQVGDGQGQLLPGCF